MKKTTDHIRDHLFKDIPMDAVGDLQLSPEQLLKKVWSEEFLEGMRVRLLVGAFRYRDRVGVYDNMESIIRRAKKQRLTGNDELLMDIANIAMIEYVLGVHPNKHFHSEDDGEHKPEL